MSQNVIARRKRQAACFQRFARLHFSLDKETASSAGSGRPPGWRVWPLCPCGAMTLARAAAQPQVRPRRLTKAAVLKVPAANPHARDPRPILRHRPSLDVSGAGGVRSVGRARYAARARPTRRSSPRPPAGGWATRSAMRRCPRQGLHRAQWRTPLDVAEPWFLTFNAKVEFRIAMTPEDLSRASLDTLGKKWP